MHNYIEVNGLCRPTCTIVHANESLKYMQLKVAAVSIDKKYLTYRRIFLQAIYVGKFFLIIKFLSGGNFEGQEIGCFHSQWIYLSNEKFLQTFRWLSNFLIFFWHFPEIAEEIKDVAQKQKQIKAEYMKIGVHVRVYFYHT